MNIIKHIGRHIVLTAFFFLLVGGASVSAQADDEMTPASGVAKTALKKDVYAMVNGTPITFTDYNAELIQLLKQRYYHGRVPAAKAEALRKELTDTMIDHILMAQEADRRGIKPDEKYVEQIIAKFDRRGKLKGKDRNKLISEIRDVEGKRSQINQLTEVLKSVAPPTPEEVRAYYDQHLDLFTQPVQMRLSVILMSVDPSSPISAWTEAYAEANKIYDQVKDGANFAELARKVSGDKSADKGGDLGYLHHGMLPRGLEDKVDKFEVGVVEKPIKMLEGWAVFRLEDRIPPLVAPFERSKVRAEQLLIRDKQDQAVKENIDQLRKTANIEINEKILY